MATAKNDQSAVDTAAAESVAEFEVTLNEFCTRQSATDRRVELIGAFHHVESVAGRVKDLQSAYAKRFADFANQPV